MFNFLFGSGNGESNLNVQQFQEKMKDKNAIILDIRTPEEFKTGHIKGSYNIDFYDNFLEQIRKLNKNKNYLLYCRSGNRSGTALKIMSKAGFKNVYHLKNGILSWNKPLNK